jgi:hypothetical protein
MPLLAIYPSSVERALTIVTRDVPAGDRVQRSIKALLEWADAAHDPWASSTLTMHGSPIEFAFCSADSALRYCVEIADPLTDPRGRLRQAVEALAHLGSTGPEDAVLRRLEWLQADRRLRFGCWIGGRHNIDSDRFKLYAEIPEASAGAARQWSEERLGTLPLLPGQDFRIKMIGYDIESRRIEFYHRALDMMPTAVGLLLRRARMESRSKEVLDLLQGAYRFSLASRLPSRDVGFSYSVPLAGGPVVFSLYFFCVSLFGGDGRTRSTVLKMAAEHDWNLSFYETLSRSLSETTGARTRHGMLGVVVHPGLPLAISVGLSPPDGNDDEADTPNDYDKGSSLH